MSAPNPNTQTYPEIDARLRELSLALGGDGANYRTCHAGAHRVDFSLTRAQADDPASLPPLLAQACGCRIKALGFTRDGECFQFLMDSDNWNIGPDGVAMPFLDGSFQARPGTEASPPGYAEHPESTRAWALRQAPAPTPTPASVEAGLELPPDSASDPGAPGRPGHGDSDGETTTGSVDPVDALVAALAANGVDMARLARAAAKAAKKKP